MENRNNLIKKLNLNIVYLLNQTKKVGELEFPSVPCFLETKIDYLVLYKNKKDYIKTNKTCLCFYENDIDFDGINGIYNAIFYANKELLNYYKKRFKDIKYAISPDYSLLGDLNYIENANRFYKARIVSLWLLLECNIQVIPNITYGNEEFFNIMLDGIIDSTVVAFSTKGILKNKKEKELLIKAIKYTVDHMKNLKIIIVYSVSVNDKFIYNLFYYALNKGIEVIIPNNLLMERNKENYRVRKNKSINKGNNKYHEIQLF